MASPALAFTLSAPVYGGVAASAYALLVQDTSGFFLPATAANRALYGRSRAMALTAYGGTSPGGIQIQQAGPVDSGLNVGAGAADRWVRASATGGFEVFTPVNAGTSDIVGKAAADGSVTLALGVWTETMAAATPVPPGGGTGDVQVNNGSGALAGVSGVSGRVLTSNGPGVAPTYQVAASGFTPPTGTGFIGVTGGSLNAAAYTGLVPGSGFIGYGSGTMATVGAQRFPYNSGVAIPMWAAKDSTNTDRVYGSLGPGDAWTLGAIGIDMTQVGLSWTVAIGGAGFWEGTTAKLGLAVPLKGSSGYSQPLMEGYLNKVVTAGGTFTLTAFEYDSPFIDLTGTPAASFILVLPTVSAGRVARFNIKNATAQAVTINPGGIAMGAGGVRWVAYNPTTAAYEFRSA